jgi:transcriptional regulator with XRE-family HTH domain
MPNISSRNIIEDQRLGKMPGMGKPTVHFRPIYLNQWLEALEMDQKTLVERTGLSQGYLSNIGSGRRGNPTMASLHAIATAMGISFNDLFRPPPSDAAMSELQELSPSAGKALLRARSKK